MTEISWLPELHGLQLSHGQVRWLLWHLNLRVGDDEPRFDAWLKYARRMGLPFYADELGRGAGVNVVYRYHHVMELAVALALRMQGILPQDLLGLLARARHALRPLYYRAYLERASGLGAQVRARFDDDSELAATGTYLDLGLAYAEAGPLTSFALPKLLGPREALVAFARQHHLAYPRPPLPLSDIANDVVQLAEGAPEIRRGRR